MVPELPAKFNIRKEMKYEIFDAFFTNVDEFYLHTNTHILTSALSGAEVFYKSKFQLGARLFLSEQEKDRKSASK